MKFRQLFLVSMLIICSPLVGLPGQIPQQKLMDLADSNEWQNLLRIENGEPQINQPQFYATALPLDPLAELIYLTENHNNALVDRFPARYAFIARHLDLPVSFEDSDKIQAYLKRMQFDDISLFYASPFLGSSMSYFGHTFLRLNKANNEMFSKVINFVGDIPDDISFASLAFKGLGGKLEGTYAISPFYLIHQKYSEVEQRQLIEYQITLEEDEKTRLLLHLYELENLSFDYSFIFNNCASGLVTLLEVALPDTNLSKEFRSIVYPFDLPLTLMDLGIAQPKRTILPKLDKLYQVYEKLSLSEKSSFLSLTRSNDKIQKITSEQDPKKVDVYSYLLNGLYDLKFKASNSYETDYKQIKSLAYSSRQPYAISDTPVLKNQLSTLGFKISTARNVQTYSLTYVPLSTKTLPFQFSKLQTGYFEIGKIKLSYVDEALRIDALHLYEFESLTTTNPFLNGFSKRMFFGFAHDDTYDTLRFHAETGIGITFGVFNGFLYLLPNVSLTANPFDFGISSLVGYKLNLWRTTLRIESQIPLYSINQKFSHKLALSMTADILNQLSLEGSYDILEKSFTIGMQFLFR